MALYFGSDKRNLILEDGTLFTVKSYITDSKLKSSDEYILKDEDNLYLTSMEDE